MRDIYNYDIDTRFLQSLYKQIRETTDTDSSELYCRKFIRQCVENELALLRQSPCASCEDAECTNCTKND